MHDPNQSFPPPAPNPYPPQYPGGGYQPINHGAGFGMPTDAPGAGTAQVCGIIGLILFFNIIGIVCNIIAIVKGSSAMSDYRNYPGRYSEASFRKAKAGKTCGIIGLCLIPLAILVAVVIFVIVEAM